MKITEARWMRASLTKGGSMFANNRFSVGFSGFGRRLLASEAGKLSMVVLLFAGIGHATPVANLSGIPVHGSPPVVLHSALMSTDQSPALTFEPGNPQLRTWTLGEPATAGCVFSGSCSSEVEVAEPQSLLLMGTGLLSMAGLIRRKLLR
jgi:hypothetical protein